VKKAAIKIYLSEELKARVLEMAKTFEVSDSTFCRMAVLKYLAELER
jgi:predicted transcriptional regulator